MEKFYNDVIESLKKYEFEWKYLLYHFKYGKTNRIIGHISRKKLISYNVFPIFNLCGRGVNPGGNEWFNYNTYDDTGIASFKMCSGKFKKHDVHIHLYRNKNLYDNEIQKVMNSPSTFEVEKYKEYNQ